MTLKKCQWWSDPHLSYQISRSGSKVSSIIDKITKKFTLKLSFWQEHLNLQTSPRCQLVHLGSLFREKWMFWKSFIPLSFWTIIHLKTVIQLCTMKHEQRNMMIVLSWMLDNFVHWLLNMVQFHCRKLSDDLKIERSQFFPSKACTFDHEEMTLYNEAWKKTKRMIIQS